MTIYGGKSYFGNSCVRFELQKLVLLTTPSKYLWTDCSGKIKCVGFTVHPQRDNPLSFLDFTLGSLKKVKTRSFQKHFLKISKTIIKP